MTERTDFSLVLGGPLFQLFRRAHLSGDALQLLRRRILVIACVAWLPLLVLSAFAGNVEGGVKVPFLYDIEAHVRFLVALPILVAAELVVHLRLRPVVEQFVERGIVVAADLPRFRGIVESILRLRNSAVAELVLAVVVFTLGFWVWRSQVALETATWYAAPDGAGMRFTPAGYWYVFVALPIFQFLLLRWYLRFFLWFWFLWRVSRLDLRLVPTHPDRSAGLGFLGRSTQAFVPILIAQGAVLAALIANQIFYAGQTLMAFKFEGLGLVAFFLIAILSPLIVFTPALARAKRQGLTEYGALASRYVGEFETKWLRGGAPVDEGLLGSADIQSLADLGNSYTVVQEMRVVPFTFKDAIGLAIATAVPLLPLVLTMFSLEEVLARLAKVLF